MARRQLTETEKARTEFSEVLEQQRGCEDSIEADVQRILNRLTKRCYGKSGDALLVLRDYAELLMAERRDALLESSRARIAELEGKLGRNPSPAGEKQ
jgi:hypothetical protein